MLATLDEEAHRIRFLARGRSSGRKAERYLESFSSIRLIHDHILQLAEQHEQPLLDTSHGEPPVLPTLKLVAGVLERSLPGLGQADEEENRPSAPTLLLAIDGLADRAVRALGGRTPLQAAATPTLDRLAAEGQCGLADPVSPGVVPDTAAGTLALFGQSPLALKRGPAEALGGGIALRPADVVLRANFATLGEDGRILDRRAGRIREGTGDLVAALGRLELAGTLSRAISIRSI